MKRWHAPSYGTVSKIQQDNRATINENGAAKVSEKRYPNNQQGSHFTQFDLKKIVHMAKRSDKYSVFILIKWDLYPIFVF